MQICGIRSQRYIFCEYSDSKSKHSEDNIKMLLFCGLAGKVFPSNRRHSNGIILRFSSSRHLSLSTYTKEFIHSLLSMRKKILASRFNFTYIHINDVLFIYNPAFENYLGQMYPVELEMKDTTESNTSASYLDLLLSIGRDGQLRTLS